MKFISDLDTSKMISDTAKQINYKTKEFSVIVGYAEQKNFIEELSKKVENFTYVTTFCKFYIATKIYRYVATRGNEEIIFERGDLI